MAGPFLSPSQATAVAKKAGGSMFGWDDAAIAATAILGKLFGGGGSSSSGSSNAALSGLPPELQALLTQNLRTQAMRTDYANPLYMNTVDAVNAMLPSQYRTHGANQPVSNATSQQMSRDPQPVDDRRY